MRRRQSTAVFVLQIVGALIALAVGLGVGVWLAFVGGMSPVVRGRTVVLVISLVVLGWWIVPLVSGGVDDTVDPRRFALLPVPSRTLALALLAAGLVGSAPAIAVLATLGLLVGLWTVSPGFLLVVPGVLLIPLLGVSVSRLLAALFSRLSSSRRGSDLAAILAGLSAAGLFALSQTLRYFDGETLDRVIRYLRWSPPGMLAEALLAAHDGHVVAAVWRLGVVAACVAAAVVAFAALLRDAPAESSGPHGVHGAAQSVHPLFEGLRRLCSHTSSGAAIAREVLYLRRSPMRRNFLITGTVLGLVYVLIVAVGNSKSPPSPLGAPLATVFVLSFVSNQFGVDPTSFWLDIVTGAPARARLIGRQVLGVVMMAVPIGVAIVATGVWSRRWSDCLAMALVCLGALPAFSALGTLISARVVVPLPDSGNPFKANNGGSGRALLGAVWGILTVVIGGALVMLPALVLRHFWATQSWVAVIVTLATVWAIHLGIWIAATRSAAADLPQRELWVLHQLDEQLQRE